MNGTYLSSDPTRHDNMRSIRIIHLLHLLYLSLRVNILRALIRHIDG
jgi:hypothetical protein